MIIKNITYLRQHMEMDRLLFIVIWYKLLCFYTQIHLKVCWWIKKLQRWVALMIIQILHHVPKQWGEMVLPPLFCTFPNVSLSIKRNLLQKHLLPRHHWSHYIQGWVSRLLKILQHLLTLKSIANDFIMSQENPTHCRKKFLTMLSNHSTKCYISLWQSN